MDMAIGIPLLLLNFALIFFGVGFFILLFMLGVKALKALNIYIRKNQ